MAARTLRIATRKSPLALWQANFVKDRLEALHPDLQVELVPMSTQGDKILDTPLAKVGGKGLFVKELETALLDGRADIAVHSMKDVPMVMPDGKIEARPMMYVALSYDHRIIDGREAVSFLVRVKECVEDPERLLIAC